MVRPDLGKNNSDSLRVFVLEVVGENVLLYVGELLPHVAPRRPADFFHDPADAIGRQHRREQSLGRIEIAVEGAACCSPGRIGALNVLLSRGRAAIAAFEWSNLGV
jgi:hypothetical protein